MVTTSTAVRLSFIRRITVEAYMTTASYDTFCVFSQDAVMSAATHIVSGTSEFYIGHSK